MTDRGLFYIQSYCLCLPTRGKRETKEESRHSPGSLSDRRDPLLSQKFPQSKGARALRPTELQGRGEQRSSRC